MKIKKISCKQFAGIRDIDISFDSGINVVYGKNESGKSTLVNLISRTLFQDAKLDGRSNKDFITLYFPSEHKDGITVGDFVDGKITFESKKENYILEKKWGQNPQATLSGTHGYLQGPKKIEETLREALVYGEGVYSNMLLFSQGNADASLKRILATSKDDEIKQEITNAVSQAFAESDGISIDAIKNAIDAKVKDIRGKEGFWDIDKGSPTSKTRREKYIGEIEKAYYAWKDANDVRNKITQLEEANDKATGEFDKKDKTYQEADTNYKDFNDYLPDIVKLKEVKKNKESNEEKAKRYAKILEGWPKVCESLKEAEAIKTEKDNRERLDKYETAKSIYDKINEIEEQLGKLLIPEDSEIEDLEEALEKIDKFNNKLCGMNLSAIINMTGENSVEITSLKTGKPIDISSSPVHIEEAVNIVVPGVMEMQLSPADVDVKDIKMQIASNKKIESDILSKYKVENIKKLKDLAKKGQELNRDKKEKEKCLENLLGDTTFEKLELEANKIKDKVRNKEDIDADIHRVCEDKDISEFIIEKQTIINGYKKEFGSEKELKDKADELDKKIQKANDEISEAKDIPDEYYSIADPKEYLKELQKGVDEALEERNEVLKKKISALSALETFKENNEETEAKFEEAERKLNEQKSLLNHWLNIQKIFEIQKENLRNNPMQEMANSFVYYLSFITDGRVSSGFPDSDSLNMMIYSNDYTINYDTLSAGTKETVSLAFRLAVLDHLFPDGGVIVFDDSLSNMDEKRTAKSCELIKECAKRHQVIFLSCKEEYKDMLNGNYIDLDEEKVS